jgi:hypothetical protein
MDTDKDDRSIVGKTMDAVKEFAATVSEAAQKAVKPEPVKSDEEITVMPAAPTGFMDDAVPPTPVVIRRRKRLPKKSQSRATKRTARATQSQAAFDLEFGHGASQSPIGHKCKARPVALFLSGGTFRL